MFLLRFEEACRNYTSFDLAVGTMTSTAVKAEQKDPDPEAGGYGALQLPPIAGTMTATRIQAEAPDSDPSAPHFAALPTSQQAILGTSTQTLIRAEGMDTDPEARRNSALPSWSSC